MRTLKSDSESRIGHPVSIQHPVFPWLVEFASWLMTIRPRLDNGRSPQHLPRGTRLRDLLCFGEMCHFKIPPVKLAKDLEGKLAPGSKCLWDTHVTRMRSGIRLTKRCGCQGHCKEPLRMKDSKRSTYRYRASMCGPKIYYTEAHGRQQWNRTPRPSCGGRRGAGHSTKPHLRSDNPNIWSVYYFTQMVKYYFCLVEMSIRL